MRVGSARRARAPLHQVYYGHNQIAEMTPPRVYRRVVKTIMRENAARLRNDP